MKISVDYRELREIRKALRDQKLYLEEAIRWHDYTRDQTRLKTVNGLLQRMPARISPMQVLHEDKTV
jgi:hypothetical protein